MIDPRLGNDVEMVVYARAADEAWPELAWLSEMEATQREALRVQYRGRLQAIAQRQAGPTEPTVTRTSRRPRPELDPDSPFAGVITFQDDDEGYLAWLAAHSDGYVINMSRGLNVSTARIHRAQCRTIVGNPPSGSQWTGPYVKVCAGGVAQLDGWSAKYFGQAIFRCGICRPPDGATGGDPGD